MSFDMEEAFEEALSRVTEKFLSFKPKSVTIESTRSAMLTPLCEQSMSLRPITLFSNSQSADT
jgi:hypothetical protein